jgi:fatty-acyl-CoA synthase
MALKDLALAQLLSHWAEHSPDQLALTSGAQRLTFAQLEVRCRALAGSLSHLGIRRGDRVAVWLNNCVEWIELQFALARLGAILVTVNTAFRHHELEYLLNQSGSRALVFMAGSPHLDFRQEVERLGPLPELRWKIFVGPEAPSDCLLYGQLDSAECPSVEVGLDEVINMQYTSGTTGFPKGVRLSSRNIVNNGYWLGQGLGYSQQDRLCLCVPLFHCFGCVIGVLGAYTHGASLHMVPQFEPLAVMQTVQEQSCTALYGVPTMFLAMLEHPEFGRFDFSSLRTGVMAGALCPEPLMRQVMEKMHLGEMTIAYGLTEASPAITQTLRGDRMDQVTQTVGKVLPELEVVIRDAQSGQLLPPGQAGELLVRGYNVMQGYHEDPEATTRAIDAEGWLATGDLASLDEEGYVRILGRIKDIIIRGGENISPKEVEDYLRTHPAVLDAAVYSVPSHKYGEEVAAALRLRPGSQVSPAELQHFCQDELAHFKIPTHWKFVEHFPLTASGKVQKFVLRETHFAVH